MSIAKITIVKQIIQCEASVIYIAEIYNLFEEVVQRMVQGRG